MRARPEHVTPQVVYADPDNPFIEVFRDTLELPDGRQVRYNRVVENRGRDGVVIMPVRDDAIGLVAQYRYPVDALSWELPRGYSEGGSSIDNAMRELCEETGFAPAAEAFVDLGEIYPNSGILATVVHAYAVAIAPEVSARIRDTQEVSRFRWFGRSAFERAVADGTIRDAFTLAAVSKARAMGVW